LSTYPANEAAEAHRSSGAARPHLPRPHLVSNSEIAVPSDAIPTEGTDTASDQVARLKPAKLEPDVAASLPQLVRHTRSWSPAAFTKRLLDIVGAVALGLIFSPLMLLIIVLTRGEGGSAIYRHRRVGRNGKSFGCLKFRTMIPNADQVLRDLLERDPALKAEWVRDHKLRDDPRVTRLGKFLRRTSLDELPQIWNVLRGEMSLVGPRPVVREELLRYGRNVRVYLATKPGITGLWQVTGRNDTDYRRRVALDTYYVRNQNLLLDLYILVKTTGVVLGGSGAY
jgi:Undecaprenyl-phosphate galactose phosphotransferase WbaP